MYTSQKCAQCGHVEKANRASQARFECQSCGYTANADINAAMNILAAGHAVIAGGAEPLGTAVKPEPLVA
ncbi:zinc ribbon domain-containing protein [Zooshikella ganghwensis]|uniref:zinc ribbon domain-containing protein n=1 Tax=Zooshikella ganghwensis TaxID=202772 RepID=UPI0030B8A110